MSAAASTLFVINETGKMYTRMMDAEMEGGGPALKFTYKRGKRTKDDEVVPIMDAMRSLPLPDWREQEPAVAHVNGDKSNRAVITKNITILQTGEGNAARELRVQGRNKEGKDGYYYKNIFDKSWKFKITEEHLNDKTIIRSYLKEARKGGKLDRTYSGSLKQMFAPSLRVELIDFYCFNSPATLRVHVKGKQFNMIFHTVDQWVMTAQEKNAPELVGNSEGEPKLLQGTLEIPQQVLNSRDPDIRQAVNGYFRRFHLEAFAFLVRADDKRVFIKSKFIQRASLSYMDYDFRRRITMDLVNPDNNDIVVPALAFTSMAGVPGLEVPNNWQAMTQKDIPAIRNLLKLNNKVLWKIKKLNRKNKLEHFGEGLLSLAGSVVYYFCNAVLNLIGEPSYPARTNSIYINEGISEFAGLSYTGGDMLNQYASLSFKLAFTNPPDFRRAEEMLKKRISLLKDIRYRLLKKT
jgi:hypothetical protein